MRIIVTVSGAVLLAACQQPGQTGAEASNVAVTNADIAKTATVAPPLTREAALKLMHDRHENYEKIGKAFKTAGRALKSDTPDPAVLRTSAATIAGLAPQVSGWFPTGTGPDVGKTMARPEIWQKPEDFAAKTKNLLDAASAFDAAAKAGDMTAIQASFGALGKTCKVCHDSYRNEHEK